ncbi:MAG: MjaI family restriction endonuclease [Anaerolineae bacterium]
MREHLEEVRHRLYAKISEQLRTEVDAITEEDCIEYVREVVIRRTYEGYLTEKRTVYEQLEQALGVKQHPALDNGDRQHHIDFLSLLRTGYRHPDRAGHI